jgi:hypothetical protein
LTVLISREGDLDLNGLLLPRFAWPKTFRAGSCAANLWNGGINLDDNENLFVTSREAAFWAVLGVVWGVSAGLGPPRPDQNAEDCYWAPIPSGPVGFVPR